jgi:hypothetical protein
MAALGNCIRLRPMIARLRFAAIVVVPFITLAACDGRSASGDKGGSPNGEALAATPARQSPPYTVRPLELIGRLTGTIEIDGPPPADSVIQPTIDQQVCGAVHTRAGIERRGNNPSGVIVWIDGLRSGKPLPLDRRFEIANERCLMFPEIQAVIAGGTLNVRNRDALEHRTRIVRRDGGEVLASIRETDEGQVVPNEHVLAKPGIIELTCTAHPWTHAWIAVFDHPYFAATTTGGAFAIDSIPPGRYAVKMWHPRLGAVEDSVTIDPAVTSAVTLRPKAAAQ